VKDRPLVLGVDPGLSGALALYDWSSGALVSVTDMPTFSPKLGKQQLNVHGLTTWLDGYAPKIRLAVVEEVGAMTYVDSGGQTRGQGAAASFNFGKGYGVLIGALATCMVPIHFVRPSVWKMIVGVTRDKDTSLELARKLFPAHLDQFKRKKDDGRAEAALLARFGAERLL
jgi:crossover junction endodeoxyribonuclease RuvC